MYCPSILIVPRQEEQYAGDALEAIHVRPRLPVGLVSQQGTSPGFASHIGSYITGKRGNFIHLTIAPLGKASLDVLADELAQRRSEGDQKRMLRRASSAAARIDKNYPDTAYLKKYFDKRQPSQIITDISTLPAIVACYPGCIMTLLPKHEE